MIQHFCWQTVWQGIRRSQTEDADYETFVEGTSHDVNTIHLQRRWQETEKEQLPYLR